MGAKTILVTDIGPIGCSPSQLAIKSVNGECIDSDNNIAINYNVGLKLLISQLNSQFRDSKFVYVNSFDPILEYRNNPTKYGMFPCCSLNSLYISFNFETVCVHFLALVIYVFIRISSSFKALTTITICKQNLQKSEVF